MTVHPHLRGKDCPAGFGGRSLASAHQSFGISLRGSQQLVPPGSTDRCGRWRRNGEPSRGVGHTSKAQSAQTYEAPHPYNRHHGLPQEAPGARVNTMKRWGTHERGFTFRRKLILRRNKGKEVFAYSLPNL